MKADFRTSGGITVSSDHKHTLVKAQREIGQPLFHQPSLIQWISRPEAAPLRCLLPSPGVRTRMCWQSTFYARNSTERLLPSATLSLQLASWSAKSQQDHKPAEVAFHHEIDPVDFTGSWSPTAAIMTSSPVEICF